jgi:hypothetical protein
MALDSPSWVRADGTINAEKIPIFPQGWLNNPKNRQANRERAEKTARRISRRKLWLEAIDLQTGEILDDDLLRDLEDGLYD